MEKDYYDIYVLIEYAKKTLHDIEIKLNGLCPKITCIDKIRTNASNKAVTSEDYD